MDQTVLLVRIVVIIPEKPFPELSEKWGRGMKLTISKRATGLKKALPDIETIIEKVIKPKISAERRMFPTVAARPEPSRAELERMARNWLKGIKHGRHQRPYESAIDQTKLRLAQGLTERVLPFRGYRDKLRGVGPFAARWLTGDKKARNELTPADELVIGQPVMITAPEKVHPFRNKFIARIVSAGSQLTISPLDESVRKDQNDRINQLVQAYASPDLSPFTTGGKSHIDFIRYHNQLYLELQVTRA